VAEPNTVTVTPFLRGTFGTSDDLGGSIGLGVEHVGRSVKNPETLALYAPSSTEIAYNFGGGVKYPLNDRLILRADLRRFHSTDLSPDVWRLYGGVTFWAKR
jgi:hypothetical protein